MADPEVEVLDELEVVELLDPEEVVVVVVVVV